MSEKSLYEAQVKKMEGLCEEHNLTDRFTKELYPIIFTIRPAQGVAEQMDLLAAEEKEYTSPNACMRWIFEDGILTTQVEGGTFTISKVLRTKIELILMRMITYWQQYFFREVIENNALRYGMMPSIDEDENGNSTTPPMEETEAEEGSEDIGAEPLPGKMDDLVKKAAGIVRTHNAASIALLQRELKIGYMAASEVMDFLEDMGVVGPFDGSAPREVLPYDLPEDDAEAAG